MKRKEKKQLAVAAGAGVLLLLLTGFLPGGKDKKKPSKCDPSPFEFDTVTVHTAITAAIADGMRSKTSVAEYVADELFAVDPETGSTMAWPPTADASSGQVCVWQLLLAEIDIHMDDNNIPPWPPCPPGTELEDGVCQLIGGIDLDPWLNPSKWPLSGTFIQVEGGDTFLGTASASEDRRSIVYATLLSTAYQAVIDNGGSADEATAFAQSIANDPGARVDYLNLIFCSPWNDALYGTFGYDPSKIGEFSSPMGRAIRLLPYHYDNLQAISESRTPHRNIHMSESSGDEGGTRVESGGNSLEFLWLPKLNPVMLLDGVISTEGMDWDDGSSMIMPPPIVQNLGIASVPSGMWGCEGAPQVEY